MTTISVKFKNIGIYDVNNEAVWFFFICKIYLGKITRKYSNKNRILGHNLHGLDLYQNLIFSKIVTAQNLCLILLSVPFFHQLKFKEKENDIRKSTKVITGNVKIIS